MKEVTKLPNGMTKTVIYGRGTKITKFRKTKPKKPKRKKINYKGNILRVLYVHDDTPRIKTPDVFISEPADEYLKILRFIYNNKNILDFFYTKESFPDKDILKEIKSDVNRYGNMHEI